MRAGLSLPVWAFTVRWAFDQPISHTQHAERRIASRYRETEVPIPLPRRAVPRPARVKMIKPLDVAAIALVAGIVAWVSVVNYSGNAVQGRIVITGSSGSWIYPLEASGTLEVPGPLGTTIVEFHGGEVHIADSPCPTKSCVQMGSIRYKGQWLACLPNEVFVRIEGGAGDVDY